jgi:hypothetical protein
VADKLALQQRHQHDPFSAVTANLLGTNVFSNAELNVFEDFAANLIVVEPVPEASSLLMLACGFALFAVGRQVIKRSG